MQESRLFKMVYYLLEKGQTPAPVLAEKFEVSVRTIYRDIDALSAAGIPVYAETGRNGGIRLMEGFVLNKAVLSEKEKQEILTALQGLSAIGGIYKNDTLEKLSALFQVSSENWLEVDFSRFGQEEEDNQKFAQLKSAVIYHRRVCMEYVDASGKTTERMVYPLKLAYKSRAWYLKAYCTRKQEQRMYRLSRILKLEVLEEEFLPELVRECAVQQSVPETASKPANRSYRTIRLRFSKEAAARVLDEFSESQITRLENEDILVSAKMPEDAWLVGFLLSFGTQAEVLEPAYLREILAEQAEMILKKNKI